MTVTVVAAFTLCVIPLFVFIRKTLRNSRSLVDINSVDINPVSATYSIERHPETNRWSFQITYYDNDGEVIGFNFFPISVTGLNEWFNHDENKLGLRLHPVDKGVLRGAVKAFERNGVLDGLLAALQ